MTVSGKWWVWMHRVFSISMSKVEIENTDVKSRDRTIDQ
jgi:hypothetical protein